MVAVLLLLLLLLLVETGLCSLPLCNPSQLTAFRILLLGGLEHPELLVSISSSEAVSFSLPPASIFLSLVNWLELWAVAAVAALVVDIIVEAIYSTL
jgi:hypothetical protein